MGEGQGAARPHLQPTQEQQEKFDRTMVVARFFHQCSRLMNSLNVIALFAGLAAFFVVQLGQKKSSVYLPAMTNLFILIVCALMVSGMCFNAMRVHKASLVSQRREQLAQLIRWVALVELLLLALAILVFAFVASNRGQALLSALLSAVVAAQLQFVLRLSARRFEAVPA
jgi:hypothetical protein